MGVYTPCQNAMDAGNHGSCIYHLGLNVCFDENNYHDSLQACIIEGIGHSQGQMGRRKEGSLLSSHDPLHVPKEFNPDSLE